MKLMSLEIIIIIVMASNGKARISDLVDCRRDGPCFPYEEVRSIVTINTYEEVILACRASLTIVFLRL